MIPGPLRRLLRERALLVAVVLLGVVLVASSGVQSAAALVLQQTLDENWRGAYDILVTADGATGTLDDLLAPNSLASGGGLSLDDVERIRGIADVDVAAPIGAVAVPGLRIGQMPVTIGSPITDGTPRAFRLTATYTTDDGLGERVVRVDSRDVVVDEVGVPLDRSNQRFMDCMAYGITLDGMLVDAATYPALMESSCRFAAGAHEPSAFFEEDNGYLSTGHPIPGGLEIALADLPPATVTRITLVDPLAEQQLLGEAGAFLDPLIDLDVDANFGRTEIIDWAQTAADRYSASFLKVLAQQQEPLDGEAAEADRRRLYENNGKDYDDWLLSGVTDQAYLPLVVTDQGAAPLTMTLSVADLGDAPRIGGTPAGFPFEIPAGEPSGDPRTAVVDASSLLNPFVNDPVALAWPGTDLAAIDGVESFVSLNFYVGSAIADSGYQVTDGGVTLSSDGFRDPVANYSDFPDSLFLSSNTGTKVGMESAYSSMAPFDALEETGVTGVPVGSFSAEKVGELQDDASYVPLGAYQPVGSTVSGGDHDGAVMNPSVSGLGIVGPETVAIAPIASAAAWNQSSPVDAVRVRVAGIAGYSSQSISRMLDVADSIDALGYQTTIVAGSSPTDVRVKVGGYAFGTLDPHGTQVVGDLGTITQRWSELGAAARAETAISSGSYAILGIGLVSTSLLMGSVQLSAVPRRRARASVMRALGFTRLRVARWNAADELPALLVVLIASAVAVWLSRGSDVSTAVSGVGLAIVVLTSIASVAAGSLSGTARLRGSTSSRVGASGIGSFAVRQPRIHALSAAMQTVALLIVGASAAALALVAQQGAADAGGSAVAQLTLGTVSGAYLALGLIGVAAGVVLAVIARRIDLGHRAPQWQAMRAMGWTSDQLMRVQRIEALIIGITAAMIVGVVGALAPLLLATPAFVPLVGVVAALLTTAVLFAVIRKASA